MTDHAGVLKHYTALAEEARGVAIVQQNPAPQSSVTLSQTAKGLTQVEVKCYATDPERAMLEAIRLYDLLTERYRQGGGGSPT